MDGSTADPGSDETWGFLSADLIWAIAWTASAADRCRLRALSRAWWSVLERPDAWVDVSGDPGRQLDAVTTIAERGLVDALEWAVAHLGVGAGNIYWGVVSPAHSYPAFAVACGGGHLDVARRFASLSAQAGLDAASMARTYDNAAAYAACENGRLPVVQWLVAECGLGPWDVGTADPEAWTGTGDGAPGPGHWLAEDNGPFAAACENGHLPVARWLAGRFPVGRNAVHVALRCAFEKRRGDVVSWLADTFDLVTELRDEALDGGRADTDEHGDLYWLVTQADGLAVPNLGSFGADPDPYAPYD